MPSRRPKALRDSQQLMSLLQQTHELCEAGLSPTEAVIKTAQEHALSPEMTSRVIQILNRSLVQAQRLNCEDGDLVCKTATIPIAIEEEVFRVVFPERNEGGGPARRKQAERKFYEMKPFRRPDVVEGPTPAAMRQQLRDSLEKIYGPDTFRVEKSAEEHPADQRFRIWQAHQDWSRKRTELVVNVKQAERETRLALGDVLGYFQQPRWQRYPVGAVEHYLREADHDLPPEFVDGVLELAKSAAGPDEPPANLRNFPDFPLDWTQAPFRDMLRLKAALERQYQATERLVQWEAQEPRPVPPSRPVESDPPLLGFRLERGAALGLKKLGGSFLEGAVGGVVSALALGMSEESGLLRRSDDQVESAYRRLTSPDHLASLASIRINTGLKELMTHDEVISGYPPEEVIKAYAEILEIAPTAANSPARMRPFLRRRLVSGGLDSFDVKELADLEQKTRKPLSPPQLQLK